MHTVTAPGSSRDSAASQGATRVAVAGATGYTGQELLRLLSRHPSVALTAAMSSGATASRKLPGLARLWAGEVVPLSPDTLKAADVVFLALPDVAAAELAPALVDAGVRVIDLSGAFRLKNQAARARWYPETRRVPDGTAYGLTELARTGQELASRYAAPLTIWPVVAIFYLILTFPLTRVAEYLERRWRPVTRS